MKKKVICITLLCLLALGSVFASKTYYVSGDTDFSIRLGSDFPFLLKLHGEDANTKFGTKEGCIGLSPAITGSLSYEAFLNSYLAIGGEIGYQLNFTRSTDAYYTQVPITFKATYIPLQTGKFDLCFNANAGYVYTKFKGDGTSGLYAAVSATPRFFFGKSWGVGLEAGLSSIFEIHQASKSDDNAILMIAPASIVVSYRH